MSNPRGGTPCRTCGQAAYLFAGGWCANCHPDRCTAQTPRGRCRNVGACLLHAGSDQPSPAAMAALRGLRPMVGCTTTRARAVLFRGARVIATGCAHPVAGQCGGHCYHGCVSAVADVLLAAGPLAAGVELAVCEWRPGDPAPVRLWPMDAALLLRAGVAHVHVYTAAGWRRVPPAVLYAELAQAELGVRDVA